MSNQLTPVKALKAFGDLFGNGETRQTALAEIQQSPAMAIQVLAENMENLPMGVRARVFDDIIGEVSNPAKAQILVEESFTPAQVTELLAARGGLPSAAVYALSKEQVVPAMLHDMTDPGLKNEASVVFMAITILHWAEQLKDRGDWSEILEMQVDGFDLTVTDLILLGMWHQKDHGLTGDRENTEWVHDDDDVPTDELHEQVLEAELLLLGIDDTDAAYNRLEELIRDYDFSALAIKSMQMLASQRRVDRQKADTLADATAVAADTVKVNLDI